MYLVFPIEWHIKQPSNIIVLYMDKNSTTTVNKTCSNEAIVFAEKSVKHGCCDHC